MKFFFFTALLAVFIAGLSDCSKENNPVEEKNSSPYKDLKYKDDVLFNLVLAYENMDTTEAGRLLDGDFIFYFSHLDFLNGLTPESWRRREEMTATRNLFGKGITTRSIPVAFLGGHGSGIKKVGPVADDVTWGRIKYAFSSPPPDSVVSISLNLAYIDGDSAWQSFDPPDSIAPQGEIWFKKIAQYNLIAETSRNRVFTTLSFHADFEIHFTEFNGDSIWRIIRWYDIKQ